MSGYSRDDGSAAVTMAILRATLIAVIFASEQLTEAKQLAGAKFYAVLGVAAIYAIITIAVAAARPACPAPERSSMPSPESTSCCSPHWRTRPVERSRMCARRSS